MTEWRHIRRQTYDYLDMLETHHLELRLPFSESQTLGYQFWCMVGAHESFLRALVHGGWQGFSCSLDEREQITPATIKAQMQQGDGRLAELLQTLPLETHTVGDQPAHKTVFRMIEHEMHHHGQLINFLFCHHLSIPPTWRDEWSLQYGS